jgi:hypothetical protein
METIKDSQCGLLAAKYQLLEMARLNDALRKNGISDKSVRYQICSDYFFSHGLLLDSDGDSFAWQGKQLHPLLCFAERHYTDKGGAPVCSIHWEDHANLYWQTEASLDQLFNKLNEDISDLERELQVTL